MSSKSDNTTATVQRYQYRVTWKRVGAQQKSRYCQTEQGWHSFHSSIVEYDDKFRTAGGDDLDQLEWVRKERRQVDPWEVLELEDEPD